jgi:hypothetical protein
MLSDSLIVSNQRVRFRRFLKEIGSLSISKIGGGVDEFGKSKILKNYTEIFVSGLSICEPTIAKVIIIVQIYKNYTEITDETIRSERPLKQ